MERHMAPEQEPGYRDETNDPILKTPEEKSRISLFYFFLESTPWA